MPETNHSVIAQRELRPLGRFVSLIGACIGAVVVDWLFGGSTDDPPTALPARG